MADADTFREDESLAEQAPPKPRNNLLTIVLLLLNVVAALGFVYLLVIDYQKRQEWSYAVFLRDLALTGLPLEMDEAGPTAASETPPRQRLTSEQLKAALTERGGRAGDNFALVEESFPSLIRPSDLSPDILRDHFNRLGEQAPVKTMEEEVRGLRIAEEIEAAAREATASAKDAAAKRELLKRIAFSLAYDVHQVDKLNAKIEAAKNGQLDDMLMDAAQRRMYLDLLAPLELYRAGTAPSHMPQKVADLDGYKLQEFKNLLAEYTQSLTGKLKSTVHSGADWDSIEKRRAIGFFLTDLALLRKPDGELLYPNGLRRAELIVGLYDLPGTLLTLMRTWNSLEEEVLAAIRTDREGLEVKLKAEVGKYFNIPGFVGKHQHEIDRLLDLKRGIKKAEERLAKLHEQNVAAQELYKERVAHMEEVGKRVVAARKETARQVEELRALQRELFLANKDLSESAERTFRLEAQIREKEGLTGDKAP